MISFLPSKNLNSILINPLEQISFRGGINFENKKDDFSFENKNINKIPFIKRGIIKEDENINIFFDKISNEIFLDRLKAKNFSTLLKEGAITLSSNTYSNLKKPQSAIGLKLNPFREEENFKKIDEAISNGYGIGVNFRDFDNPIQEIKKINSYLKQKENSLKRPPATIALLDVYNKNVFNFITLKDNEDYSDWCFDLSIILDNDFLEKVEKNKPITLSNGQMVPARKIYQTLLNSMLKKGEPAVIFSNDKNYLCDCCAAKELKENETLTIGQVNLSKFYDEKTSGFNYQYLNYATDYLSTALKNLDNSACIGVLGYAELLEKMNLKYGSKEANELLGKILQEIKNSSNGLNLAISPTGTTSRMLKTTPSIEPNEKVDLINELETLKIAQENIDYSISKTIILDENSTKDDINKIIQFCYQNKIKGISVFKP